MTFDEILRRRRSIRQYEDRPLDRETVNTLLKSALLSPSSRGIRPWEFILVEDRPTLEALSRVKPHGASFVKGAAAAVVVIADTTRSDVWVEDTSIASVILLLAAESLGLGACWSQIRKRNFDESTRAGDRVREILAVPDNYDVEAIIAVGHPAEQKAEYTDADLHAEKLHDGRFGEPYRL